MTNPWMHIAVNHDRSKRAIGRMRQVEYVIEVELFEPLTRAQIFEIFGGAGIFIKEQSFHGAEQVEKIHKFDIPEFSYCPQGVRPAAGERQALVTKSIDENERMRAALHRIIALHDRVDLIEAQSIAESALVDNRNAPSASE